MPPNAGPSRSPDSLHIPGASPAQWVRLALLGFGLCHVSSAPLHAQEKRAAPVIRSKEVETVTFPSLDEKKTTITSYAIFPHGPGPFGAVVAMHGCGGLFKEKNGKPSKKMVDWARRLNRAGYAVVFPDSFASRDLGSICGIKNRPVSERQRARDARGAAEWLAKQPVIDRQRIAVLGWSNGGTTTLWTTEPEDRPGAVKFATAISFYPWCRDILENTTWKPATKITILIGGSDDWTPAEPCEVLSQRWGTPIVVYDGAYHSFDHPDLDLTRLTGLALSKTGGGVAHQGTDMPARVDAIGKVMEILEEDVGKPE